MPQIQREISITFLDGHQAVAASTVTTPLGSASVTDRFRSLAFQTTLSRPVSRLSSSARSAGGNIGSWRRAPRRCRPVSWSFGECTA